MVSQRVKPLNPTEVGRLVRSVKHMPEIVEDRRMATVRDRLHTRKASACAKVTQQQKQRLRSCRYNAGGPSVKIAVDGFDSFRSASDLASHWQWSECTNS